ncbi:styrene monooxygenase/indole monooxygenase family protein [Streptomyces fuscigenes]|uniref:styrene monooxygenase/indole monooxygenase family protein n=1 Tax=Streptomyces fuscigenes TaxID=1528880 RepID=UPI001F3669B0|nr:styrene monooxygenase/indole monooxygenase family protein [Streptomyces fuscigenes]MCF3964878.1 FAD-binding oxidoreductase [Streptomyces fuscigenes]
MRNVLVVGAGQSGLHLALGLQAHGYAVTLMSNRTPDEVRNGRVMSTQVMFHTALQHERDLGLGFWESQTPSLEGLGVSVAAPDHSRAVDWLGRLEHPAQSVDQRIKMAGWMETFAQRGGQLVIHGCAVSDLDYFSGSYDLVLVSAGKGELVSMFERDPGRSEFDAPQRALAVSYVHGLAPRPEHPDVDAVRCNLVPGVGELFVIPALTVGGRADILFWEGLPGGPVDAFRGVTDPGAHLALTLRLMEEFTPWEYARATNVELTDAGGVLAGRFTPTVRRPVAALPGGGRALGVADVVVANDPVTGQGSNSAAKCAAVYLDAILARGGEPFDEAWMRATFETYWRQASHATKWTNALLGPPPEHVVRLLGAAERLPAAADRFANGFDDPSDFEDYFYDPAATDAYLKRAAAARTADGPGPAGPRSPVPAQDPAPADGPGRRLPGSA